jgi:Do/DeqQ family serine protease
MKKYLLSILFSLVTVSLALVVYHYWFNPREVVLQEIEKANFVRENEVLLNGKVTQLFKGSAPDDFTRTARESVEAVVFIRISRKINGHSGTSAPEFFRSTGSGVIISSDGLIVTNQHVIEGAENIYVTLHDNREFEADLLGEDQSTDLALLQIKENNLPFLFFGNSDSLQVGEWVLAIGNPFRLQSSVTAGIVSAKARNINLLQPNSVESYIQTDAAVNPGNSGGALVNRQGLLVGIIGALMSESGRYEGFSFAIPSQLAQKVIYDIKKFGSVQRGWLGVTIIPVNNEIAQSAKLDNVMGVFIQGVSRNGAADDAGIRRGDIITSVNGIPVKANADFMELVARHRPGESIMVEYYRNGTKSTVEATLKNSMNTYDLISIRRDEVLKDLGFELRELSSAEVAEYGSEGILVVSVTVGGKMHGINLEPGYIITQVNGDKVREVDEFIDLLDQYGGEIRLEGFYKNYPGSFPYVFDWKR